MAAEPKTFELCLCCSAKQQNVAAASKVSVTSGAQGAVMGERSEAHSSPSSCEATPSSCEATPSSCGATQFIILPGGTVPRRGTANSAGWDLCAAEDINLPVGVAMKVRTGVCVQLPEGTYGRVAMRSGAAYRNSLVLSAGVIDRDYRDEISLVLIATYLPVAISAGDRLAQLIVERCDYGPAVVVDKFEHDLGTRHGGFGSTG